MNLKSIAIGRGPNSTLSKLYVDDVFECYVLEDTDRGLTNAMPLAKIEKVKVKGRTAIPAGRYEVLITMSNRFKKLMPLLLRVPGFGGIRIHAGVNHLHTEGCLLPGSAYTSQPDGDYVLLHSRLTYDALFAKMQAAERRNDPINFQVRS